MRITKIIFLNCTLFFCVLTSNIYAQQDNFEFLEIGVKPIGLFGQIVIYKNGIEIMRKDSICKYNLNELDSNKFYQIQFFVYSKFNVLDDAIDTNIILTIDHGYSIQIFERSEEVKHFIINQSNQKNGLQLLQMIFDLIPDSKYFMGDYKYLLKQY